MTTVIGAVYELGWLKPTHPLSLPEHARVQLTVTTETNGGGNEQPEWLAQSERALLKT